MMVVTNSYRATPSADLVIGSDYYGSIDLQGYVISTKDQGSPKGFGFYLSKDLMDSGTATYSRAFNFYPPDNRFPVSLGFNSSSSAYLSFPSYDEANILLNSVNDSSRFMNFSSDSSTQSQIKRFGFNGFTDYSVVYFNNISTFKINTNINSSTASSNSTAFIDIDPWNYAIS
jgi:hypothetical protein